MTNDRPHAGGRKYVAYFRVSTERQGQAGLGIEAQRAAVASFVSREDGQVVAHFVEVESGKRRERPELAAALVTCRKTKATLLIAKLDRLARSVHFISGMMEAGVEFVAVDNPHANRLMLHLLAAFAEHEREMISQRTKAALAAARSRGTVLGAYGKELAAQNRLEAIVFARGLQGTVNEITRTGCRSLVAIAEELNARDIRGPRGGSWHPTSVRRLMARLAEHSTSQTARTSRSAVSPRPSPAW